MDETVLHQLKASRSSSEKAAIIAEAIFELLPEEVALVARRCVIFHWFDQHIVEALRTDRPQAPGASGEMYNRLTTWPFIETVPWGLTFQDLTREGLLKRYSLTHPELLRTAARLAAPIYQASGDKKIVAEALFCHIISGERSAGMALLDTLLDYASMHEDWQFIESLLHIQEEAEALPFVQPLPHTEQRWMLQGLVHRVHKRWEEALLDYDAALVINPQSALAYLSKGTIYAEQQRFEEALSQYNRALSLDPKLAQAYVNRGVIFAKQMRYTDALAAFEQALQIDPFSAQAYEGKRSVLINVNSFPPLVNVNSFPPLEKKHGRLGNYRLLRQLGQGGFAEVYLSEHVFLGTYAAIKLLQVRLDDEEIQAFLREARTLAGLTHPNILRILDFGVEGNIPYLVMDYAPNGTLRQRYPPGKHMPPLAIISYTRQLGAGLQYLHNRGLIHRHVKPSNMMLGSNDELMLGDFGIAVVAHPTATHSISVASGTARYMAPEQILGKERPASDQYALATVIYEWFCGSTPFSGDIAELYAKHMYAAPPPLHEKMPTISPAVDQVILKALAKDPHDRFPSVQEFVNALEQAGRLGTTSTEQLWSTTSSISHASGPISIPTPTPAHLTPMPPAEVDNPTVLGQHAVISPFDETVTPASPSQRIVPTPGSGAVRSSQVTSQSAAPQSQLGRGHKLSQRTVILLLVLLSILVVGSILSFNIVSHIR